VFAGGENLSKRRDSKRIRAASASIRFRVDLAEQHAHPLQPRVVRQERQAVSDSKPIVWWDEQAKRWTGHDVPMFLSRPTGPATPNGQRAFHLSAEGVGRLFAAVYKGPRPQVHGLLARRRLRAEGRAAS
jgi:formate dehydrogenase major subunit